MFPTTTAATMSSMDLLGHVNAARSDAGENKIRRNDFNARVTDELDGEHYETFVVENVNGTTSTYFQLTHDQCMLVAMRESKVVRRRVLELIEHLKTAGQPKLPQTMAEALRLAADQAEEIERQQALIEQSAPKVEFVDSYVDSTGLYTFRQVCKVLGVKEREFREFLVDSKIMYRQGREWLAYSNHVTEGRFATKVGNADNGHAFTTTKFTAKGFEWIAKRWGGEQGMAKVRESMQ